MHENKLNAESSPLVAALRQKRQAEGLSIRALSAKIGVSFSSLARIERGDGEPDNNSTIRILNWLGGDAKVYGLSYREAALVHFRAAKNAGSKTIQCLIQAADAIKAARASDPKTESVEIEETTQYHSPVISLSKSEMEAMATRLRSDINVKATEPLEALSLRIIGVDVVVPSSVQGISPRCQSYLTGEGKSEWSAMSVPLDSSNSSWVVLRNDAHQIERQRVTYLEECWHILLGHKLTRIARVADSYGRTYDAAEEHDAFYLAAATLLPESSIHKAVLTKQTAISVAAWYGVSVDLVEYRIKRLGLWSDYKGISVELKRD